MADKDAYIKRVQAQAQMTFEVVTAWNTLVKEALQLGYLGMLPDGTPAPELALTDADIASGQRGDPFDAQTFIFVVGGAKTLSEQIEAAGSLAAMCKIKA